jgi:hypothetical protein
MTSQSEPGRSFQDSVGQQFGLTEVVLSIALGALPEYHEIEPSEPAKKIPRCLQSPGMSRGTVARRFTIDWQFPHLCGERFAIEGRVRFSDREIK